MTIYTDNKEELIKEIKEIFSTGQTSIGLYEKRAGGETVFLYNIHKSDILDLPRFNQFGSLTLGSVRT